MAKYEDNFWRVYWGPDEAKGDEKLNTYFIEIPEYEGIKRGDYRYIIGRKGTGKTAIIEQLTNEIDGKYNQFHKYLSLKNFPIQTLRNLKDKTKGDKSQFVPIWTFLLLTELCKLIIQDENATPTQNVIELELFIKSNFPSDLGFNETLKILAGSENKVSVLSSWLGIEGKSSESLEVLTPVHFQKVTEILGNLIRNIKSDCSFFLFFDELDEGYSVNDKSLNLLLLALFRAIENTYIELKEYIDFRPVLALRSDIFENLEDNDLNKLDDYLINLKWTTESQSPYSLLDLVNARINASLRVENPQKAWECISVNKDPSLPRKIATVWDFIYNRTFERPRDVVKYMKICSKFKYSGKINFQAVKTAERDYSEWFFKEFRDEIQSHLSIWQPACQSIIKLGKGVFSLDEIKLEMDKDSLIANFLKNSNKTHEDVLEKLFEFGVIGNLSVSKKWFFKYKDNNLPFNPDQKMLVHFGFSKKFRINAY
ncbi:hypothetical protein [uncultured Mucilaginibacter sp.]|uniref:P-loop ATPase, Sll1717 family n=1 Tax=uncultured Mucilaginibacter sp. TaxID=797541 RepID=UPI0025EB047C|nr:hypothetical protein [uncultured Mucilaginibacter sp.]